MPPTTYSVVCKAISGVWHAAVAEAPDLTARGDPLSLMLDLSDLLKRRLGRSDIEVSLYIKGWSEGVNVEQIRLSTISPRSTPPSSVSSSSSTAWPATPM